MCFLKETKLWSWKGWKLSLKSICTLSLLRQCASSCLLYEPLSFFQLLVAMGQKPWEEIVYLVTLKWASKLHGSLTPAPAALGWLLYQRQKSSHNCLSLWICWLSGKCWCAGWPRCSPHEPHFAIESTELHWSGERFWNELFLLFSKCLECLFNVHLMLVIYFLIVLKISRSEQFESNLFHVRKTDSKLPLRDPFR